MLKKFFVLAVFAFCSAGFVSAQDTVKIDSTSDVTIDEQPVTTDGEIIYDGSIGCGGCYDPCERPCFFTRLFRGGCFNQVREYCPPPAIVSRPALPPVAHRPYYGPRAFGSYDAQRPYVAPRPCFAPPVTPYCVAPICAPVYVAPVVYAPVVVRPYFYTPVYYGPCF
ncbi:MAG: hypothetical protein LBU65_15370 [Planctomycetaceae bacterium]|jgi:hypothetical protein|nr:hypothetical protein [Planctomycetaceae bacterium]